MLVGTSCGGVHRNCPVNHALSISHRSDPLPTKKPIGYTTDKVGRRRRVYDKPRTPYQRLLDARVLNDAQQAELAGYKASLNVVQIAHRIDTIRQRLISLAAAPTRRLEREIEYKTAAAMPEAEWIKIDQRRAPAA